MTKVISNPPDMTATNTAQIGHGFLRTTGLLWKINTDLLHPLGLALVVSLPPEAEYNPDDPLDPALTSGPLMLLLMAAEDGEFQFDEQIDGSKSKAWATFLASADLVRQGILLQLGRPATRDGDTDA